ncbi:MAG: hypothetical protein AAGG50_04905 [Bacteroidota bacterium]
MSEVRATWLDPAEAATRAAWAALIDTSPYRTPFAALAFGEALTDALASSHGLRLRVAGLHDGDGHLVGGVLVYERRRGPYRLAVVPPLASHTPVVLAEPLRDTDVHHRRSALDTLLPFLEAEFHALAFHLHPAMHDVRAFVWAGYQAYPRYTYHAPLDAPEEMVRASSRGVKKHVRRDTPLFDVACGGHDWTAISGLMDEVFERQGSAPPLAHEQRDRLIGTLIEAELAYPFVLKPSGGGAPEGVSVALADGQVAHQWTGASRPGPAMTLLTHAMRCHFYEVGLSALDLTGANMPTTAEFKRSFGATLTSYYRVERYVRPELRALAQVRPFL